VRFSLTFHPEGEEGKKRPSGRSKEEEKASRAAGGCGKKKDRSRLLREIRKKGREGSDGPVQNGKKKPRMAFGGDAPGPNHENEKKDASTMPPERGGCACSPVPSGKKGTGQIEEGSSEIDKQCR